MSDRSFRVTLHLVAAAAAVTGIVFVGGALGAIASGRPATSSQAQGVRYGNFAKSNWAGYIASGSPGTFTSAVADWTQPSVTCLSKSDLYAPWVGIDGSGSETVEQTGVQTSCKSGKPKDKAWYEMYPSSPVYYSNPVSTGDKFEASVTESENTFTLTIEDLTKGWAEKTTQSMPDALEVSAEAVIEAPGGFPAIKSVSFTGVKFDGADLTTFDPSKTSSEGTGKTVYRPTAISDGDDFNVVAKS